MFGIGWKMENKLLTVLIPAFNSYQGVVNIVELLMTRKNIALIVGDDSTNVDVARLIESYISGIGRSDFVYYKHESTGNAVDNWNFLLSKVKSKFFVLVHHDEAFSNTLFIDTVEKYQDSMEIMVLPVTVEHSNGVYRNVKSLAQSLMIKLLRNRGPTLNFIGGPTALLIIKSSHINFFNRDLVFYVDIDWYIRIFSNTSLDGILFFPKTSVISSITGCSITKNILPRQREVVASDIAILKGYYPNNVLLRRSAVGFALRVIHKLILLPSFAPFYFRKIKYLLSR